MLPAALGIALWVATAPPVPPASPIPMPPAVAERVIQQTYHQREREEYWFRSDAESHLGLVQRVDFGARTSLVVGRAADCDLRIDDPIIQDHHLRVTVVGDSFHVQALDDSALIRSGEAETRDTTLAPTSIGITSRGRLWGRYHVRTSHQRHRALLLFDASGPRYADCHGLKHFPVDLKYRFLLPMTVNPTPDTLAIASTRGPQRPALRLGWFDFLIGTRHCRLTAIRMLDPGLPPDNVAVFFRDATSGKETCALGRYLDVRPVGTTGKYVLDFNGAANPSCAFSDLYNCPVPPKENTLKVAINAGEKDLHYAVTKK
jgi:uncharacterized protein (DUF1684 family)